MNSACIDSNVIINYYVGDPKAKSVLEPVISGETIGYIISIVFSEVIFVLLKLLTNMKSYELKNRPLIVKDAFKKIDKQVAFLKEYFTELEVEEEIKEEALNIILRYGLLPNDAIIAAACKYYNIDTLITFDEDFKRIPWLKILP